MRILREIASPGGTLAFRSELGAVAVEGGAPSLTYAAYFEGLERFVSRDGFAPLWGALAASGFPRETGADCEVVLRAEKHGALYHPASVTVRCGGLGRKLCVNVAATPVAVACLEQESELLAGLRDRFAPEFLPCPHAFGRDGGMAFLLEEWFSGFHEFHQDGAGHVRLWDYDAGERTLSDDEAALVYQEAARIMTRYFDADTGAAIGPWHHAAGDFVARAADGRVDVRLITVRGHGPSRSFVEAGPMAGRLAALAFFANMTMRMRLDRVDGVGRLVLADERVAEAAVGGFVQALGERADVDDGGLGVLDFLGSFSVEEMAGAGEQLMDPCPPEEEALLRAAWPAHAAALVAALAKA